MNRRTPQRIRTRDVPQPPAVPSVSAVRANGVDTHLNRLQEQFDELRARIQQAQQLSVLGQAAATIAHEVNNLLTPIRTYAQAALECDDVDLQRKALRVTLKNVDMLVGMSARVLEIGAAHSPTRQSVCVRTVAEGAAESLCRDLSKDGIRFSVQAEESLTAWVDPLNLQQILFNLFLNAREAMAASRSGRLTVSGRRENRQTLIEVRDNGPGIPSERLPHVFEALQTSKQVNGNGRQRCAGLGLALCRQLVEDNGGTIRVASEVGNGTVFTISLPAEDPESN